VKEQKIQKRITDYLGSQGHHSINVITSSTAGTSDIVSCGPDGRFWAIEVKRPGKKPSELQWSYIRSIQERNGIAFYADSFEDFKSKYHKCAVSGTNCFKAPPLKKTLVDL